MNKQCEIVRDLLPLYADDVISPSGREYVDEHLKNCSECSAILRSMKQPELESCLEKEKAAAIEAKKRKNAERWARAGEILAALLFVPVVVCFLVNLFSRDSMKLDWFFIVLASVLVFASMTVVPLLFSTYRVFATILSFMATYTLLIAFCCLYSGGRWFWVVFCSSLFGWSVSALPLLFRTPPMNRVPRKIAAFIVISAANVSCLLMLIAIQNYNNKVGFLQTAFRIAVPLLLLVWLLFLFIRFGPKNRRIKTGCILFIFGVVLFFMTSVISFLAGSRFRLPRLQITEWTAYTIDGNLSWLFLGLGLVSGLIFILVGIHSEIKRKKESCK